MRAYLPFAVMAAMAVSAVAEEKISDDITFTPIEHASMVIQAKDLTIYVDPVGDVKRYQSFPKADIILITHIHHDHLAPKVVAAVKKKDTKVIGPKDVIQQLKYGTILTNGDKVSVKDVKIEAIPAYNTTKERLNFHPKGRDNGYVLTLLGERIYIAGDTEDIKEMRALKDIDFAFICVNLPYTMTVEQAASAILAMKPKVVTPYHYRGKNGKSDLKKLKSLVAEDPNIDVRLINWYPKPTKVEEK